jgi:DNA primase
MGSAQYGQKKIWGTQSLYHENLLSLGMGKDTPFHYLRSRGLSAGTIREYQLGYCPKDGAGLMAAVYLMNLPLEYFQEAGLIMRAQKTGRLFELFWGRITIPDRNLSRQTIYMVARQFPPDHPKAAGQYKYLSLNGLTPPLIGWGRLDRRPSEKPVFLVEAPMCYLTLAQWGYDALARNGTGMPEADAERLRRLAGDRPLVIIPQNDKAGVIAAARWKEAIGLGPKAVRILWLPELKGESVKDVNDLAQVEEGQRVFEGLVKKRMLTAREQSPPRLDDLDEE